MITGSDRILHTVRTFCYWAILARPGSTHPHGRKARRYAAGEGGPGGAREGAGAFEDDWRQDAERDCAAGRRLAHGTHAQDGQHNEPVRKRKAAALEAQQHQQSRKARRLNNAERSPVVFSMPVDKRSSRKPGATNATNKVRQSETPRLAQVSLPPAV